jgi:hypothetical protein
MEIILIHNKQVALCFECMQSYKTPDKLLEERQSQKVLMYNTTWNKLQNFIRTGTNILPVQSAISPDVLIYCNSISCTPISARPVNSATGIVSHKRAFKQMKYVCVGAGLNGKVIWRIASKTNSTAKTALQKPPRRYTLLRKCVLYSAI